MKPEDQRIAFLEYLGWTDLNRDSKLGNFRALRGTSPDGKKNQIAPNPLKDLNIIHEAEKMLNELDLKWQEYLGTLWVICNPYHFKIEPCHPQNYLARNFVQASSTQRLEAFLKTVDRWKE